MEKKENREREREERGSISSPQIIIITCKSILICLSCLLMSQVNFIFNWFEDTGLKYIQHNLSKL